MNRLVNAVISTSTAAYQYPQRLWKWHTVTAKYTQEQLKQIYQLQALVLPMLEPVSTNLPKASEQTIQLIETRLRDAEQVLGIADSFLTSTYACLGDAFLKREDWANAERYYTRILDMAERSSGRRSKRTLYVLHKLVLLYLKMEEYDKFMEVQYRVADLQAHFLPDDDPEEILGFQFLKEVSYPQGYDRVEAVQRRNLEIFEKAYGSKNKWTAHIVYQLIRVCARQCCSSSTNDYQALRYIRDVVTLSREYPGAERLSREMLLRMCLSSGFEEDAVQAYRYSFDSREERLAICANCGSEDDRRCGNGARCDMCQTHFTVDMKRHVCEICVDIDVCGVCYSKEHEEKASLEPFLSTCRNHTFFELPEHQNPHITLEAWTLDLEGRVSAQMERLTEKRRDFQPTDNFDMGYVDNRYDIPAPVQSEGKTPISQGYLIDKLENTFSLNTSNPHEYAKTLWRLERLMTSPATYFHRRLLSNPLARLLMPHITTSFSEWAYNVENGLPPPFCKQPPTQLIYESTLLSVFLTPLTKLSVLIHNPCIQETTAFRAIPLYQSYFGSSSWKQTLYGPGYFRLQYDVECKVSKAISDVGSRLLKLLDHLSSKSEEGGYFLGACLFDYDGLVGEIEGLRAPYKEGGLERDVARVFGEILDKVAPLTGSVDEKDGGPKDRGESKDANEETWPPRYYDELQDVLTECESEAEVAMRVRVVLRLAAALRNLSGQHAHTQRRPSFEDFKSHVTTIRTAEKYWRRLSEKSQTRQAMIKHLVDLYTHVHSALNNRTSQPDIDLESLLSLTDTEQEHRVDQALYNLEKQLYIHSKDVTAGEAEGDSNPSGEVQNPKDLGTTKSLSRTFFTTTSGFAGFTVAGTEDLKSGDSMLLLENAVSPIVVRKVEGSDLYESLQSVIVREFADGKWKDSEKLEMELGKMAFQIRA